MLEYKIGSLKFIIGSKFADSNTAEFIDFMNEIFITSTLQTIVSDNNYVKVCK